MGSEHRGNPVWNSLRDFFLNRWWAFVDYCHEHPDRVKTYGIRIGIATFVVFLFWEGGCVRIFPDKTAQERFAKLRELEQLKRLEWARPIKPLKSWAVGVSQPSVNQGTVSVTVEKVDLIPGKQA